MRDWREALRRRLAPLHLSAARETEIADEIAQHFEHAPPDDAELDALVRELAAVERRTEEPVEAGTPRGAPLAGLLQDLRYGVRTLRNRPGFTLIAVLTIALGVGANTAIFSAVRGVLLRPLPYDQPDRLATFWLTAPAKGLPVVSLPEAVYYYFKHESRAFTEIAAYTTGGVALTGSEEPERISGTAATPEFFHVLGIRPLLGRTFQPADGVTGAPRVAVLSYGLWQRRYGGDSTVIGKPIRLSEVPGTIIGVMPQGFDFASGSDVWWPLLMDSTRLSNWWLSTVARLRPGVGTDEAAREIATLMDRFKALHPDRFGTPDNAGTSRAVAKLLLDDLVGGVKTPLLLVLSAVALVLLIACANVATLLLARATARAREMALRCSLGASTRRIGAQLITESLVLALLGGTAGLMLALWMVPALRHLAPNTFPRLELVRFEPPVLLFALAITLLTGLLFGLAPALRGSRVNLTDVLNEGTRGSASMANRRWNDAFVVGQFALSLLLLIGASLLLRSFQKLLATDPGFRPDHVLTARIALPGARYTTQAPMRDFYQRLLEQMRALPGAGAAGLAQRVPLTPGNPQVEFLVEDRPPDGSSAIPVANVRVITPGFFAAMGIPLLRGRTFEAGDDSAAPRVAIVDQSVVQRYWPGQDPIGKRVRGSREPDSPWLTVVGVVATAKHTGLDDEPTLHLYLPYPQAPQWTMYAVLRTRGDPLALVNPLRRIVKDLDANVPVFEVGTMQDAVDRSLATRRFTELLLAGLAATALLLASIGIYGVMSLNVTARMREFGIRLALGAAPRAVRWQVIRRGMALAGSGVAIGLGCAVLLTRFLKELLYQVDPVDPLTFAAVATVLALVALAACYLPARRATRTDPMMALRQE